MKAAQPVVPTNQAPLGCFFGDTISPNTRIGMAVGGGRTPLDEIQGAGLENRACRINLGSSLRKVGPLRFGR
jgi:hypothetical protein